MVTALGIDVRKAFTLVFALGGAAAALAGVLSGVYYGVVDPEPRHVAPDLRLHRRRHRRLRLDRRHRRRRRRGRADPAVRELLRVERARRPRGRAPARDRAPAQARGARSEGGAIEPRRGRSCVPRRCSWRASRVLPLLSLDIPVIFGGPLDSPGTLGLLALCLVFAGVALTYDLLFGFTGLLSFGHALYFAIGVYLMTIALTKWEWGFARRCSSSRLRGILVPLVLGAISLRVGGIAFAMVTLAFAQAGPGARAEEPERADRRRGGARSQLRGDPGLSSSASSTRSTSTGSRSATRRSSSSSCAGR